MDSAKVYVGDKPPKVVDLPNLLLGLAWLGEAATGHVQRLWLPHWEGGRGWRSAWRVLRELQREGYVERRAWAMPRPGGGPPIRQDLLWSLGRQGHAWLHEHDQYPMKVLGPRSRRMIPHDVMTTEIVVRIIELGRAAGLSGVFLEREVRLDPERTRPIMDGLVILRTGGGFDNPHRVPWTKDPRAGAERRRRYALENDRDSEPISVIIGKAHAYQQAGTAQWLARYGTFPIPLWVVPHERRREAILNAWADAWPGGKWLITTDDDLQADRWTEYHAGRVRTRGLFHMPGAAGQSSDQSTP